MRLSCPVPATLHLATMRSILGDEPVYPSDSIGLLSFPSQNGPTNSADQPIILGRYLRRVLRSYLDFAYSLVEPNAKCLRVASVDLGDCFPAKSLGSLVPDGLQLLWHLLFDRLNPG